MIKINGYELIRLFTDQTRSLLLDYAITKVKVEIVEFERGKVFVQCM